MVFSVNTWADFTEECINVPGSGDCFSRDWNDGSFDNVGVYTYDGHDYLRLDSRGGGTWTYSESFNMNVEPTSIKTDSEISSGSIEVEIQSGGSSDTVELTGGDNEVNSINVGYGTEISLEVNMGNPSSTEYVLEETTLHEIELTIEATHTCEIDEIQLELESPSGEDTGWFDVEFHVDNIAGECPDEEEVWGADGYSFCPEAGNYDGRTRVETLRDAFTGESSWEYSGRNYIYNVDYNEHEEWCECGADQHGYDYVWLDAALSAKDDSHPRCCGADQGDTEIWETGGDKACAYGNTLENGEPYNEYLNVDGILEYCREEPVDDGPVFLGNGNEWGECDMLSTNQGNYYCGTGVNSGEWHSLEESGCQIARRIRGGRIEVTQ